MTDSKADADLLTDWKRGDNRAGNTLVQRHFQALYRFFCNKAHGHEEDLIQQTFMASIEAKDAFRGESTFRAYLFGLARFQLLAHYRKTYRNTHLDFVTTSIRDLGTTPTGALTKREEAQLLELALQRIPVDQQIALELTYWEELSAPDIARVLDISENTVYSRLRRAKAHLREALGQLSASREDEERAYAHLTRGER
jgi:RNA polymerase sigma-70 factor (ECF subfamily)